MESRVTKFQGSKEKKVAECREGAGFVGGREVVEGWLRSLGLRYFFLGRRHREGIYMIITRKPQNLTQLSSLGEFKPITREFSRLLPKSPFWISLKLILGT